MDLGSMFKLSQAWKSFTANHPKVPAFVNTVRERGAVPGMEIAVAVRYPDGTEAKAGIRVQQSDMELLEAVMSQGNKK